MKHGTKVITLEDRRELFLDDFLIHSMSKGVERRLHHPVRREVVLTVDEPHERGNVSNYHSIVRDNDRWLYYYRGRGMIATPEFNTCDHEVLCVAETFDGIHFKKCQVNLLPEGYNVVLNEEMTKDIPSGPINTCPGDSTVFLDTNPDCLPEERFKMIVTDELPPASHWGMYLFVSQDGFRFTRKSRERFKLSPLSRYDSANLAFFDHEIGEYRIYHRRFRTVNGCGRRTIMTHRTKDFIHFYGGETLKFDADFERLFRAGQQLYTNNIGPYFRAPHILLGFPARYYDGPGNGAQPEDWNISLLTLPGLSLRAFHSDKSMRLGTALTETVLIAGRDGVHFKGFGEAFLRPGPQQDTSNWFYGDTYFASGMIPTASDQGHGAPDELSFYFTESGFSSEPSRIRRCSIRMDGFVSLHFSASGGLMQTPPFTFKGGRLTLNMETGAFGRFRAGFLDENGKSIPGYTIDDACPETGDSLELIARWKKKGCDLRCLEGRIVSLRIQARDADLYSLRFVPYEPDPAMPVLPVKK